MEARNSGRNSQIPPAKDGMHVLKQLASLELEVLIRRGLFGKHEPYAIGSFSVSPYSLRNDEHR